MGDLKQAEVPAEPAYSFKPSLVGSPWMLRLTPDHLVWNRGRSSGRIAYRDIARIRLSFRPVTMQPRRYLTEIWAPGTPKLMLASASWKSMVEQESLLKPYSEFVREVHRRVAESGGRPRCESGLNPFIYWPGLSIFVAILVALAGLIVRALQVSHFPGALFVGAFMAFSIWQLGSFFKLNKPLRYSPDAPPQNLLPL